MLRRLIVKKTESKNNSTVENEKTGKDEDCWRCRSKRLVWNRQNQQFLSSVMRDGEAPRNEERPTTEINAAGKTKGKNVQLCKVTTVF